MNNYLYGDESKEFKIEWNKNKVHQREEKRKKTKKRKSKVKRRKKKRHTRRWSDTGKTTCVFLKK